MLGEPAMAERVSGVTPAKAGQAAGAGTVLADTAWWPFVLGTCRAAGGRCAGSVPVVSPCHSCLIEASCRRVSHGSVATVLQKNVLLL